MAFGKIDQRAYKKALHEAVDSYSGVPSVSDVLDKMARAEKEHPNYLNNETVRDSLHKYLLAHNAPRAKKFVDHLPDTTAPPWVVASMMAGMAVLAFGAIALVVGLAIFLFQYFFG